LLLHIRVNLQVALDDRLHLVHVLIDVAILSLTARALVVSLQ